MRRLRQSPALRELVQENEVTARDLIYPMFFEEEIKEPLAIESMPGVLRYPETMIGEVLRGVVDSGVKSVMLFGVSHNKDAIGSDSFAANGLTARMMKAAKQAAPDLVVMADACFCEYTDHGHCGVVENGDVHNDQTLENLAAQAVVAADNGADVIAPSGMMDGMVSAIRDGLDSHGHENVPIMSYSSKFASAFYGPFREAAGCDLDGDRRTYQINPANGREAQRESAIDESEAADILMVKPGMPYLDVVARIRDRTDLPLAVYQVSGEYAMIRFAAAAGAIDEEAAIAESLMAFKRAGADLILTYFARDFIAANG